MLITVYSRTQDAYAVDEDDVMRIRPGGQAIDVYKRPSEPGDVVSSTDIRNVPRDEWCHFVGTWNLMPSVSSLRQSCMYEVSY